MKNYIGSGSSSVDTDRDVASAVAFEEAQDGHGRGIFNPDGSLKNVPSSDIDVFMDAQYVFAQDANEYCQERELCMPYSPACHGQENTGEH